MPLIPGYMIYQCDCEVEAYPSVPLVCETHKQPAKTWRAVKPVEYLSLTICITKTTAEIVTRTLETPSP